jgi:hypothetical protein
MMKEYLDKIKNIESMSHFDRAAIDLLIEYSHDDNLLVRYHAYCQLNSANLDPGLSKQDWELLPRGVLLNPGDLVWSVYQSGLVYTDDEFIIFDLTDDIGILNENLDLSSLLFAPSAPLRLKNLENHLGSL